MTKFCYRHRLLLVPKIYAYTIYSPAMKHSKKLVIIKGLILLRLLSTFVWLQTRTGIYDIFC